jgi:alpha-galactosidase
MRLAILGLLSVGTKALNNGVGKLPKMGYNSNWLVPTSIHSYLIMTAFNAFGCGYNEEKLLAMAHSMVEEGLVEAGYNSIIFDDCFTQKERGVNGELLEGTRI